MKTNKTKFITKIISCFLCTAITLQAGLALTVEKVNAAGYVSGAPNDDGSVNITLNPDDDGSNFYISNTSGDIIISINDTDQTYKFSKIAILSINGGAYTYIDTNLEISTFHFDDGGQATLQIDYGYTLTIPENSPGTVFSSVGRGNMFIVEGALDIYKFRSSEFGNVGTVSINDGTVISDEIDISGMNIMSTTDSKLVSEGSIKIGSKYFYGTVVAQPGTEISVDGGSFNLQVEYADGTKAEKKITGETGTKTAEEWLDDPDPKISRITDTIYVGEDYDFSDLVSVATGYDKSLVKLQYSKNQSTILDSKPSAKGNGYYVRAVAPAYGSFREAVSSWQSYDIDYIPIGTLIPSATPPYCTTNVNNGYYVQGGFLIITPPDGIEIGSTTIPDITTSSPLYLSRETIVDHVLNDSGEVNADLGIYFVGGDESAHPGAMTDEISIKVVCPEIENLVFDYDDPEIILESVDGIDELPYPEGEEITTVACDYVTFGVSDAYLDKIYLNDELYEDGEEIEDGYIHISLSSVAGEVTNYTIKATDLSGRESTYSISLYPPPGDPILTIVVPSDPIYVDDDYEITAGSHSDKEPSLAYYTDEEEPVLLDEKPTEAGDYIVVATLEESDFYNAAEKTAHFSILKRTPTIDVSVPKTYVDDTVSPEVTGVPDDYNEELIKYEYKLSTAADTAYSETVPEDAGEYTVRVTLPETRKYNEVKDTATFTINKYEITNAKVSVDNILVGQTPSPSVTGVPSDYEGEITYSYKDSDGAAHAADTEFAAGTYTVVATIPESRIYSETTLEATFTVGKYVIEEGSVSVSVKDIKVGEMPSPSVIGAPSDYDGNVTYQYKPSTSEDSAYTTTVPTTAGVYTVMAILEPTDKYSGTSCTSTFSISKIAFEPTLTVSDIYVGGTVKPVLDGVPEDYDGTITYQYKLSTAANYSSTVPSAAGEYEVLAVLPETDKYFGISCTYIFTISKIELDPTLTVSNIYVGETVTPVWDGIPDDYDGTITFVYIDGNGNSYSAEPLPAGNYLVRATIPETDKYERAICEADLEVRKNDITEAKVTIENIKVGQTPAPVVTGLPDDYVGEITFAYIDGNGNSFSGGSLPAGSYLVRATIPETDKYERAICETDLVVSKNDITGAKVTVEDIVIGQTPSPSVTGVPEDYDGNITFEYKLSTAPDTSYSSTVPAEPGTYSVLAIVPETDVYMGTSISDTFVISKNAVSATISVADITYGGKVNPVVTTDPADYDGKITFDYKVSTDPDTSYSSTVPVDAGTYMVRATLSTTEQFLGTTCTDSFEIKKKEITATVSVADVVIGETIKPVVTTISDGTPVFEYKASTAPDSDYSSAVPTAAGSYTVRATIPETKNYLGTTCTDDFKITKKVVTATVKVADITVGQKPSPVVTTESDGKDKATFEYKASSAPDSAFSSAVPTAKGTYTVRATIPETDTYEKIVCSASFEIKLNPVTVMDLSVPDTYAGLAVKATFNTDSDGTVTIMYKASGASDTAYSAAAPKEVGSYVARASVSETAKYEAAECTANFRIVYLEAPATPFVMSGTTGKNGYYTSDVVLNAPAGYTISTTFGTGYSASVPYTEGLTSIYLKRNDGALTGAISIGTAPKIDKVAPSITSSSGSISNGSVVYTSGLTIGANDPHLASLTVNGQSVNPATGMTLTPGMWIKTFTITAEDEAGNVTTISITLKAQWLENKILPADVELPLPTNEVFYFGEGQWIVTKIVKGEKIVDPTVYNGNTPFYVDSAADSYYVTLVT